MNVTARRAPIGPARAAPGFLVLLALADLPVGPEQEEER